MAHHVTSHDIPAEGERLDPGRVAKLKLIAGGGGALLFLISLALLFIPATAAPFAYSYLFAFIFFVTLALGGCFWTLLHSLSNSGWGTSVRRMFENLGYVFPFMAVFVIPFFLPSVQQHLYEWFNAWRATGASFFDGTFLGFYGSNAAESKLAEEHSTYLLKVKAWYMNPVAWYIRMAFYFIALGLVIKRMRSLSVAQDTDPNPGLERLFKMRAFAAPGLPIFAITATFLAFDLVMALDFTWFSTMWGVYFFAGCALSSMAVLIITGHLLQKMGYLKNVVTQEHYHIMGKFLFAFTVFWAYVSFSQFFLIWYANITEETRYFLVRNTEHWHTVSLLLVFCHFGLPFLALLRSDVKKKPAFMIGISIYILVVHALDVYHMIIPERGPSLSVMAGQEPDLWMDGTFWYDILAFVAIGLGFLFFYLRNLLSVNLYPNRDPRILESANLHN